MSPRLLREEELWFAWKIVPLRYTKQLKFRSREFESVVICLKNRTFAVYKTTYKGSYEFKSRFYLLEKSYLCGIQNNWHVPSSIIKGVVICLKNRTFAVYKTTRGCNGEDGHMLWFAWKIVPLRYTKQQRLDFLDCLLCCDLLEKSYLCGIQNNGSATQYHRPCGCDLLEKSYLCGIQNNNGRVGAIQRGVVICLKNRTFAVYKTTSGMIISVAKVLWFAWKIVPLRYTKQLEGCRCAVSLCCDLLEKSYLCGIQNN